MDRQQDREVDLELAGLAAGAQLELDAAPGDVLEDLVDGEFAANNGGWQWAASTGTDAAPYFRIFNPTTQSERFDPEGEFIARWVPELASLAPKKRHAPTRDLLTDLDYPAPIVDHRAARERALDAFKSLSKDAG